MWTSCAKPSTNEPFSALAFKIVTHPFVGKLTYVRVYSGKVESGPRLQRHQGQEGAAGPAVPDARQQGEPGGGGYAGHIYAVIGLKDTTTGDTLCDPNNPIVLESMTFPEPGHRGGHRAQDQEPTRKS